MNKITSSISTDMNALLADQKKAFNQTPFPSLSSRRSDLKKLKNTILKYRDDCISAASEDFGHRSRYDTEMQDLMHVILGINHMSRKLARWMRPERRTVNWWNLPARARIQYQPLGVVGIMSPWNYPFTMALLPLATALAAGNRAIIKPSEFTPASSALIQQIVEEIFPREKVAVVTGDAKVGAAFSSLPFDHLFFTGSTAVGKKIMENAAKNLVPVTLELGGKSPAIIGSDVDMAEVASSIVFGRLSNGGQACIAPDYVLVHRDKRDEFVTLVRDAITRSFPKGTADPTYTSVATSGHFDRVTNLVEDARSKGADIIQIDPKGKAQSNKRAYPATVLLNVTDDMAVTQEEIFGPLLPVLTYDSFDDAISYVVDRPRPLALYFFGKTASERDRVLTQTHSGGAAINDTMYQYVQKALPFGGIGPSGIGAYHGIEGFKTMSHAKAVFYQSRLSGTWLARPPYGKIADVLISVLIR
ncbi:MAG: coniferyl aldehyde dehydrogenase [Pseudomonadota bacterium]